MNDSQRFGRYSTVMPIFQLRWSSSCPHAKSCHKHHGMQIQTAPGVVAWARGMDTGMRSNAASAQDASHA